MAFISADQLRKVRLKGAKPFIIDGLDLKLQIIKLSSSATLESGELQKQVNDGTKKPRDVAQFMLANGIADEKGDPIGMPAALELLNVMPVEELNAFMGAVRDEIAKGNGPENPSEASTPSSSPTG